MIYSDSFIWLHFPKCAGTKIERIFNLYYQDDVSIHQDIVDIQKDPTISWHDSIADRERRDKNFSAGNREIICSFRSLPSWLASRYNFEVARSPHLNHDPNSLLKGEFLEASGKLNNADRLIARYLPYEDIRGRNVSFIRTEFFEEDFKQILGRHIDISRIPEIEYQQKENASQNRLSDKIIDKLQTVTPYQHCPVWSAFEYFVYPHTGNKYKDVKPGR